LEFCGLRESILGELLEEVTLELDNGDVGAVNKLGVSHPSLVLLRVQLLVHGAKGVHPVVSIITPALRAEEKVNI